MLLEQLFVNNKGLLHTDISYCGFNKAMVCNLFRSLNTPKVKNLRALHITIDEPDYDQDWLESLK
jgi:hypothetical protein